MKTEYRPIAMRCTQEQFDSIKDRMSLPMDEIDDFNHYNYLVNNFQIGCDNKIVTNLMDAFNSATMHEGFDGELFLDCCGREKDIITQEQKDAIIKEYIKDKVWDSEELQSRFIFDDGTKTPWQNEIYFKNQYRIKPRPDYSKEIEALKQKAKENGQKVIIKFE